MESSGTVALKKIFDEYGSSHQHPVNVLIHRFAVPLIQFSLMGLLDCIPGPIPWMWILVAGGLFYYLQFRNVKLMAVVLGMVLVMAYAVQLIDQDRWQYFATVFVVSWIFQFIGHSIEGKKPSFLQDLQFLLIGPAWVTGRFIRYY